MMLHKSYLHSLSLFEDRVGQCQWKSQTAGLRNGVVVKSSLPIWVGQLGGPLGLDDFILLFFFFR